MINFYAHRARNNHSFKDNSKEAILSSINKDYISGVEIDIRLTKDKKIVIYHDPIIIINGKLKMINEVNYIDLNKSNIYRLKDILDCLNTNKKIILEIKYENKIDKNDINIFINEIEKYSNLKIYLCSFNTKLIKIIKKNSNLRCGIIVGSIINKFRYKYDFSLIKYDLILKIPKYETFIWTVNDMNKLNKIIKKNNTKNINIITDKAYLFSDIHQSHLRFPKLS